MTDADAATDRARMVGLNHVALEVGDVDAAVEFLAGVFEFEVRGRLPHAAFLDMGDQFLALVEADDAGAGGPDDHRHLGLVVDDASVVERRLDALDVERLPTDGLDFRDPWGNRIQVVEYAAVQFTKADHVLAGMGVDSTKSDDAIAELAAKGMAPDG